ncbi:MAG: sodium:proton exchanger [Sphaerobacteraceae bacterium]|nr:MAG: sodium:proton exchanger [Sphaerobacteraceae bacterium]
MADLLQFDNAFYELAALLVIAIIVGAIATLLRQPLIISFIAVGIIAGPAWLSIIQEQEAFELLANIGIALLLFVVGLKLDIGLIRQSGPVALYTGLGQVLFTSIIGFGIALLLGISMLHALYVAVALTFSSTIIIVKLLSDKREIDSLHGRIAIGLLIVQDIVVVLVMIGLTAFGAGDGDETSLLREAGRVLVYGTLFVGSIVLITRYAIGPIFRIFARSQELLVLGAIGWALILAASGDMLGLSKEVGAFIAGVSLASTPFREAIGTRLVSLRDFLLLFFFLSLGADLDLSRLSEQIAPALAFSAFVLIGNPIIVMTITGLLGYRKRTGFLSGLTVAQISEFSLILAAMGLAVGHIDEDTLGLITLVGLVTIGTSTYLILYSHQIYERIGKYLSIFEREHDIEKTLGDDDSYQPDIIVYGLGRYGGNLVPELQKRGYSVLGVDFDPQMVQLWHQLGLHAQYGDAEDPEFPGSLPTGAKWIISTMRDEQVSRALLHGLEHHGYPCNVAVTADRDSIAERLRDEGADLILMPYPDAAKEAADILDEKLNRNGVVETE